MTDRAASSSKTSATRLRGRAKAARALALRQSWRAKRCKEQGWKCALCGHPMRLEHQAPQPLAATLDHVVPLAAGSADHWENTQAAHHRCNRLKGAGDGGTGGLRADELDRTRALILAHLGPAGCARQRIAMSAPGSG